ncbi:MAG: hypothetical protein ACXVEF_30895 [Polyangiales bacterium]
MPTLAEQLRELLSLVQPQRVPDAEALLEGLRPRARSVTLAGPQLVTPPWAYCVGGADDVFVELADEGDVVGVRLWNDARGFGARAELSVVRGTLADVEAAVGPTRVPPQQPGAFSTAFADPTIQGHRVPIRVFHQRGSVRIVTIVFDAIA